MNRANANFNVKSEYAEGVLKCTLSIDFTPYNCIEYRNEYKDKTCDKYEEQLQWLYCTLYNYIPFALIRNTSDGFYNDITTGNWEEIDEHTFWENTQVTIDPAWKLGEYGQDNANLFTRDLKALAEENITADEDWYYKKIGRVFAFSNAINGSILFSANTPKDDFLTLLKKVIDEGVGGETYNTFEIWRRKALQPTINVELTTTLNIGNDGRDHTYAIVAANPSDSTIFTEYIYIQNTHPVFDNTSIGLVKDSIQTKNCGNKILVLAEQVTDKSVVIKLNMGNKQWTKLHPQVKFKVKLKRMLS